MSTDLEVKIAVLENRLDKADDDIEKINMGMQGYRDRFEENQREADSIRNNLGNLIKALEEHNRSHDKQGENRWKYRDFIIAFGMLILAIVQVYQGLQ